MAEYYYFPLFQIVKNNTTSSLVGIKLDSEAFRIYILECPIQQWGIQTVRILEVSQTLGLLDSTILNVQVKSEISYTLRSFFSNIK
jgi:hypothetical protein